MMSEELSTKFCLNPERLVRLGGLGIPSVLTDARVLSLLGIVWATLNDLNSVNLLVKDVLCMDLYFLLWLRN